MGAAHSKQWRAVYNTRLNGFIHRYICERDDVMKRAHARQNLWKYNLRVEHLRQTEMQKYV